MQLYYCDIARRGAETEYCSLVAPGLAVRHQKIDNWCPRCGGVDTGKVCCGGPTFGATLEFPCPWCGEMVKVVWLASYRPGWKVSGVGDADQDLNPRYEAEHAKCLGRRIAFQRDTAKIVRAAIANFPPRSGNGRLANTILQAVGIRGASVTFFRHFSGGEESEPGRAVIRAPRRVYFEVPTVHLLDWSEGSSGIHRRLYRGCYSRGRTPNYSLNEGGEVVVS